MIRRVIAASLSILVFLASWEIIGRYEVFSPPNFFPPLSKVLEAMGEWQMGKEIEVSSKFFKDDLKDPSRLAIKLRDHPDLLHEDLSKRLSEETVQLLDDFDETPPQLDPIVKALIDDLNRLIDGESLYNEQLFEKVTLREKTNDLKEKVNDLIEKANDLREKTNDLKEETNDLRNKSNEFLDVNPEGMTRTLNRMLLEDIFPDEIAKTKKLVGQGDLVRDLDSSLSRAGVGFVIGSFYRDCDWTVNWKNCLD